MMKRNGHYNNNKNRFQQGGGHRQNFRKGSGNHNNQFNDMTQGDAEFVHPRQRRHLQAQKDRYVALARDALGRGDRILAEFYYQHVEHFSRMIGLIPAPQHHPRTQDQSSGSQNEMTEASDMENGEGEEGSEADAPLPTGFGGGPSSFYTQQPSAPAAPAPEQPSEDENAY